MLLGCPFDLCCRLMFIWNIMCISLSEDIRAEFQGELLTFVGTYKHEAAHAGRL